MAANEHADDDFTKELDAEMLVDLERLREASKYGIPLQRRKVVWKYLLQVSTVDKSAELTRMRKKEEEYQLLLGFSGDGGRLHKELMKKFTKLYQNAAYDVDVRNTLSGILRVYLCSRHASIHKSLSPAMESTWCAAVVCIAYRFLQVMPDPVDTYHSLTNFMDTLYQKDTVFPSIRESVSTLSMLFRHTQPALYQVFEAEEVYPNEWALEWITTVLSKQLPPANLMRLWDLYLVDMTQVVHSERLMELERIGILELLNNLPESPMERVITIAFSVREDILSRGLYSINK